ncbi:FMRFamide receptor-like [Lineus longissimus]|uniref:FMRFamide receptor-like n=1 Tax=Lineus longissimus TaxID=88925 RepID=UPI002B4C31A2
MAYAIAGEGPFVAENNTHVLDIIQHPGYDDRPEVTTLAETIHEEYAEFYRNAKFVTGIVLYPILCTFGITGNILSLIVLSHKKMSSSTNVFLSALSVSDLIKLVNDVMYFIVVVIERYDTVTGQRAMALLYPSAHYILNMSVCVTAWLTVSVSVERYISVCHPTRAKTMCTIQRARIVSVCVFIGMSILALPSGLRYENRWSISNETNQSIVSIELSVFGQHQLFKTAYTWIQNLLRSIIPLFVLVILNSCIIYALWQSRIKGKTMSSRNRISIMLIIVVFVFLICITPDAILSTFFKFGYYDANNLVRGIREISDLLLQINSAVNFVLYCTFSTIFRGIFIEIFLKCFTKKLNEQRAMREARTSVVRDKEGSTIVDNDANERTKLTATSINNCQQTYV